MRKLHYFPTVHLEEDIGSIKNMLRQKAIEIFGREEWQKHLVEVSKSWDEINDYAINLISSGIKPSKIKIYQDGISRGDEVWVNIVKIGAKNGIKNYEIVNGLIVKGAVLEGGDSLELLLQEHKYLLSIKNAKTQIEALKHSTLYNGAKKELTKKRDKHIAEQINASLTKGDVGLAFFGTDHSIVDKLNPDINVTLVKKFKDPISLKIIEIAKGNYSSFTDIM